MYVHVFFTCMCMYTCLHAYAYRDPSVSPQLSTDRSNNRSIHLSIYECIYACTYMCVHVCMRVCLSVCAYTELETERLVRSQRNLTVNKSLENLCMLFFHHKPGRPSRITENLHAKFLKLQPSEHCKPSM